MKYCRFLLANQIHYGAVEERKGELWITGPAPAPATSSAMVSSRGSRALGARTGQLSASSL